MSQPIEVSVDGSTVTVDASATVLEAASEHGLFVPHLCHDPDLEPAGVCRLCLVEVDGRMVTACNTPVTEGAKIQTDTEVVPHLIDALSASLAEVTAELCPGPEDFVVVRSSALGEDGARSREQIEYRREVFRWASRQVQRSVKPDESCV